MTRPTARDLIRIPLDGGASTVADCSQNLPGGLSIDGNAVYWSAGNLTKVPLEAGAPVDLFPWVTQPGAGWPAVKAQGDQIYFTGTGPTPTYSVGVFSLDAGTTDNVKCGPRLYSDAIRVGGVVLMIDSEGGLMRWPECTYLAVGLGLGALKIRDGYAYWRAPYGHHIERVPLDGGSVQQLGDLASGGERGLDVDGTHVYWTERTTGQVRRVALDGGTVEQVSAAESAPEDLVLDGTHVYWTDSASGQVRRWRKP